MSPYIRSLEPSLFWDTESDSIDATKHRRFVIGRVLERGGMDDWQKTLAHYGLSSVVQEAQQMRTLSPKTLAFVACVGGVKKESFRCFALQRSHQRHWSY